MGSARPPEPGTREYPNCFGCGKSNSSGLRLDMKTDGEYLTTEFTPQQWHEGWPGIVHGGIIAAVLYEVMENWPYLNGVTTMMRRMDTRLIAPQRSVRLSGLCPGSASATAVISQSAGS